MLYISTYSSGWIVFLQPSSGTLPGRMQFDVRSHADPGLNKVTFSPLQCGRCATLWSGDVPWVLYEPNPACYTWKYPYQQSPGKDLHAPEYLNWNGMENSEWVASVCGGRVGGDGGDSGGPRGPMKPLMGGEATWEATTCVGKHLVLLQPRSASWQT